QDLEGATLTAGVLYSDWSAGDEPPPFETIGVVDGQYLSQASETGREHFRAHVSRLDAAGYDVRRVDFLPDIDTINERHESLVAGEMALSHDEWYEAYGDRYAEETRSFIERGKTVGVGELCSFRNSRKRLRESIQEHMDDREIDVVVSPSAPGPAPSGIESTGNPVMNLPWTHALLPTVSVPASTTDDGLPIGLQCTTRSGRDEWLLSWCREIESALDR
ncbi:MAG: amidase family protein, partial [Halodesulfurarchaeum sp.]